MQLCFPRPQNQRFLPLSAFAMMALMSLAAGCASQTDKHKTLATGSLKDFRDSLDTLDSRVESSVAVMDRLQSSSTFDLNGAYQEFLAAHFNISADANEV